MLEAPKAHAGKISSAAITGAEQQSMMIAEFLLLARRGCWSREQLNAQQLGTRSHGVPPSPAHHRTTLAHHRTARASNRASQTLLGSLIALCHPGTIRRPRWTRASADARYRSCQRNGSRLRSGGERRSTHRGHRSKWRARGRPSPAPSEIGIECLYGRGIPGVSASFQVVTYHFWVDSELLDMGSLRCDLLAPGRQPNSFRIFPSASTRCPSG